MHVFRHPKYYEEYRARAKRAQREKRKKQQAASGKQQATSDKQQASKFFKHQATSSKP